MTTTSWRIPAPPLRPNPLTGNTIRVCPECAGPVVHNSGCISCRQCGWGRCS